MAHFAKIDGSNVVLNVCSLHNSNVLNGEGVETESVGQAYLQQHNNWPVAQWIQTSYNTFQNTHREGGAAFRGNYAGIGGTWDSANNIFWPPKPYGSWVKNVGEARWQSPAGDEPALTPQQENDNDINGSDTKWHYSWNEGTGQWDLETHTDPYIE